MVLPVNYKTYIIYHLSYIITRHKTFNKTYIKKSLVIFYLVYQNGCMLQLGVWDLKNLTRVLVKNVEKAQEDNEDKAYEKCLRKPQGL